MGVIFRLFNIIRKFRRKSMVFTLEGFQGEPISFDPSEFIFAGLDASGETIVLVLSGRALLFLPATLNNFGFLKLILPSVQKNAIANLKKVDEKIHAAALVNDLTGAVKAVKIK